MAAADALAKLQFSGKQTRELLGQRDITYTETAQIIGAALGKPNLAYTQLPNDQAIPALMPLEPRSSKRRSTGGRHSPSDLLMEARKIRIAPLVVELESQVERERGEK